MSSISVTINISFYIIFTYFLLLLLITDFKNDNVPNPAPYSLNELSGVLRKLLRNFQMAHLTLSYF